MSKRKQFQSNTNSNITHEKPYGNQEQGRDSWLFKGRTGVEKNMGQEKEEASSITASLFKEFEIWWGDLYNKWEMPMLH